MASSRRPGRKGHLGGGGPAWPYSVLSGLWVPWTDPPPARGQEGQHSRGRSVLGGSVEGLQQGQILAVNMSWGHPQSAVHTGLAHLHMPLLAQRIDHPALDGPAAGPADGDPHLVVAGQAVELALQLPGLCGQLLPGRQRRAPSNGNAQIPPLQTQGSSF